MSDEYGGTYFGGGAAPGTGFGPAGQLDEILWAVITTAPTDTPEVGTMRLYINEGAAAPYRRLYVYSASGWSYVEV